MNLGLFLDLRNPPPWHRDPATHMATTLERCVAAEHLGLDALWFSEHHFFEDGYLPQPLLLAAAVAARTERVRLGTAVLLGALRSPVHIAEEAALIDLISNGRLELGFGAGYREAEYAAFDVDITKRMSLTEQTGARVRELLDTDGVTPGPVQRPFPIWFGFQGPQGARRAGRQGAGLLCLDPKVLPPYREGLIEGGHDPSIARTGGVIDLIVTDDPERDAPRIRPHYAYQQASYRNAHGGATNADTIDVDVTLDGTGRGLAVVTPDDAIATIRRRAGDGPVEHVYLWLSMAGMDDDIVERHIELLGSVVAPALKGQ